VKDPVVSVQTAFEPHRVADAHSFTFAHGDPEYPALHGHENDPGEFRHAAFAPQRPGTCWHSFTSAHGNPA
jgi:hypothetical protein